jgi:hypothetical protein
MLQPGARLGALEVLGPLGAGGMGEVYRARDTRLAREVAVKILPAAFVRDDGRLARIEREARLLATLNHPGIAAIYGLEQSEGSPLLVLELVEGPTLAERLRRGPLPVKETVDIGRQIAEALEAAHERGIIHRDLKPSNIKLTPRGSVKLLDFGLARTLEPESAGSDLSKESTETSPSSLGGVLGTAPYMSPEQARGQVADRRADLWAFGCVLYEMLTGKRAFPGATVSDTVAAVLEHEPDWAALPESTPAAVSTLIRRCLRKDRERRLHDIADARIELEDLVGDPNTATAVARRERSAPWWAATTVSALTILAAILVLGLRRGGEFAGLDLAALLHRDAPPRAAVRWNLALPADLSLSDQPTTTIVLSPDGSQLVFPGRSGERTGLYRRRLGRLETTLIPGTEDGSLPFFSPDGHSLGFLAERKLKRISLSGGAAVVICDAPTLRGAAWAPDGTILMGGFARGGLMRVSADGGQPADVTTLDPVRREISHRWPQVVGGGRIVLFTIVTAGAKEAQRWVAAFVRETGEVKRLVQGGNFPRYANGYLTWARGGSLLSAPFDLDRLELTGPPRVVSEDVVMSPDRAGLALFDVAEAGPLVYVSGYEGPVEAELQWFDRQGRASPATRSRRAYYSPSLSPDGRRVAVVVDGVEDQIWIGDLMRDSWTRLTHEGHNESPVWSADGKRIVFTSRDAAGINLFWVPADEGGPSEQLTDGPNPVFATSVSRDGRTLLSNEQNPATLNDISLLSLDGERRPRPFVRTPFDEQDAKISPDGRLVAYTSRDTGSPQICVRPGTGTSRWIVSSGSGEVPAWSHDGREIFFRSDSKMMAISVSRQGGFQAGKPRELFDAPSTRGPFDVSRDGRFLMVKLFPKQTSNDLVVMMNWVEVLGAGR